MEIWTNNIFIIGKNNMDFMKVFDSIPEEFDKWKLPNYDEFSIDFRIYYA